ncbi:DNA polymerase Y family protein [Ciceribacter sp. S95]
MLALWFPRLSTDRLARRRWGMSWRSKGRPEHPPVVCAGRVQNSMRLTALDEAAEAIGLRTGQGLAEARAICPTLDVAEADQHSDRQFLEAIADWCDRYTPLVAIDGVDGLLLDITGCAHLFGGEQGLIGDILGRLLQLGLEVRGAISSTPGLSWAAARFSDRQVIADEAMVGILSAFPMRALRIDTDMSLALARVGLKQVGDLLAAPRGPLTRRFGPELLLRLDQALGREGEPIVPRRPVALLSVERRLAEPVRDEEAIPDLVGRLATGLRSGLEARGEGGRLFELLLFRVDGRVFRIEIGAASPLRDAARIKALFNERMTVLHDDLDAGFGFEILRLNVLQSEPLDQKQVAFGARSSDADQSLDFIDRVAARFGRDFLRQPVLHASHWPERASGLAPLVDATPAAVKVAPPVRNERPMRLLAHPEPVQVMAAVPDGPPASFRWRRALHRVVRAEGPERLSAEWWIDGEDASPRDYFRIEDSAGHRFWLYRQGLYERGATDPDWFMQGLFA